MNRIPVSEPDFSDPRDKINRIPPPPEVPERPELTWTRRRCPQCYTFRTMPVEWEKCGDCMDIEEKIKYTPRRSKGKGTGGGAKRDHRTKYLDRMNAVRVERGLTYPELRRRLAQKHDDRFTLHYLQGINTLYSRVSYERMQMIADVLGCRVEDLYTEEYNQRRDRQDRDRR